ncbi:MAG: hypothetical protein ACI4RO_01410 [Candidatus Scatosoma sp.]
MKTKVKKKGFVITALALAALTCFIVGRGIRSNPVSAAAEIDTTGMKNVVTENSTGKVIWSAPGNTTPTYTYSENGGKLTLNKEAGVSSACAIVTNDGIAAGESVLEFTTKLSETSQWEWNHVIFRGDSAMNNFIAFAFRNGGGHMTVLSRYEGVFYSFGTSDIIANISTVQAYPLSQSAKLSALNSGAEVSLRIWSTDTQMKVYMDGETIFESALAHRMLPATGVLAWGDASSNTNIELSNVKNYVSDYTAWNNAVKPGTQGTVCWDAGNAGGISYVPADKNAGASIHSSATVTGGRYILNQLPSSDTTVHTFTAKMPGTSSDLQYNWNYFVFRADATGNSFIAYAFRPFYGHRTLISYDAATNCWDYFETLSFANNQEKSYAVAGSAEDTVTSDTLDVTVVSSEDYVSVFYGNKEVYNAQLKVKLPAATGLFVWNFSPINGYMEGGFDNIRCYDANVNIAVSDVQTEYDGTAKAASVSATRLGKPYSSENLKIEYKKADAADSEYNAVAPIAAGSYDLRVTVDGDKDATNKGLATACITIAKANYAAAPSHGRLTGTYDPEKVLADYALDEGFTWKTPATVPTVVVTEYGAIYNGDSANYNDFETTVQLVLEKAEPVVTLPDAGTAVRGTKLSDITLTGGAGATFAFKEPDLVLNELGNQTVTLICTPEDTQNYLTAEKNITVEVVKNDADVAAEVQETIAALPETVTLENESAVQAARAAYDKLNTAQKALVTNLSKLENAESALAALKAEQEKEKSGCGGSLASGVSLMGMALLIASAAVIRKRREN